MREREAETQAEGEAGSMHQEPDAGFDPGSPGSRPGPKAGVKPLRHPGIPMSLSSLVRFLFMSFAHFMIGLFVVLLLRLISSLYILDTSPLVDMSFANIFFHSEGCLLVLLFPLLCRKCFILMKSQSFTFAFVSLA